MAGFLNAALPSDDEEDDDYNPIADDTAEREDRPQQAAAGRSAASKKRRRGAAIATSAKPDGDTNDDDDGEEGELEGGDGDGAPQQLDPRAAEKQAKVASLWQEINARAAAKGSATERPPSAAVNLAALCRSTSGAGKKARKADPDAIWMRSLGLLGKPGGAKPPDATSPRQAPPAGAGAAAAASHSAVDTAADADAAAKGPQGSRGPSPPGPGAGALRGYEAVSGSGSGVSAEEKRALAAAALAAARDATAAGSRLGKVAVTEVRRFAGKDVQVTMHVDKDSKEAQKAAARAAAPPPPPATSGLDAILAEIEKKKKVSVLDKTKADWSEYKAANTEVDEELEIYKKSGDQFLEKQNFLKRAELREYEKERDTRLASDVRTRGRL